MSALTLYDIESHLAALLDTEALVTLEDEAQFHADLAEALVTATEKRDRVAQFLAHCEAQQSFCSAEMTRLCERKARFEHAQERMERAVIATIQGLGKDDRGKWRKLEGRTSTLALRRSEAVEVTNQSLLPPMCLREVPATTAPDKAAIKLFIKAGAEVPGAELRERFTVSRK